MSSASTGEAATSVIVLSDVHGNAAALEAALAVTDRRRPDQLVFLGDLLTYGANPSGVLEQAWTAADRHPTIFVKGNHDEFYLELAEGRDDLVRALPDWIRRAVEQTAEEIDLDWLGTDFPFVDSYEFDGAMLAHANPFGPGDWTYLNADEDWCRAGEVVASAGLRLGVFGHTHRPFRGVWADGVVKVRGVGPDPWRLPQGVVGLVNAGAVGQPRGGPHLATLVELVFHPGEIDVQFVPLTYDLGRHLAELDGWDVPPEVRARLQSYFKAWA